jgi:hypothetical protein
MSRPISCAYFSRAALELLLVGEHLVVHLPELALGARGHTGLRRQLRLVVEGQRVVTELDADLLSVRLLDLVDGIDHATAEGALEVRELDDGDLRRVGPFDGRGRQRNAIALHVRIRELRRTRRVRAAFAVFLFDVRAQPIAEHERHQHAYDACTLTHF